MKIGKQFDDALQFAAQLHRGQTRKATTTPYISHLMAVAGLILEFGGNEDQAIAALLHDAVEDQSEGFGRPDKLRAEIGRPNMRRVPGGSYGQSAMKPNRSLDIGARERKLVGERPPKAEANGGDA
jgi:hypothetical protein